MNNIKENPSKKNINAIAEQLFILLTASEQEDIMALIDDFLLKLPSEQ